MTVRRTGPDDWQVLRALRLAALRTDPDAFSSTLARERRFAKERWLERCANPNGFMAWHDGLPAGLAALAPPPPGAAPDEPLELVSVWVAPEHRGQGVGDALVASALAAARDTESRQVRLSVVETNAAAIRLYAKHGFAATDACEPMPGRPHLLEIEMVLDLRQ